MNMMGSASSQPAPPGGTQDPGSDQLSDGASEAFTPAHRALLDSQLTDQAAQAEPEATPPNAALEGKLRAGSRSSRKAKTYSKKNRKSASADTVRNGNGDSEVAPIPSFSQAPAREPSVELGEFLPPARAAEPPHLSPVPESQSPPADDGAPEIQDIAEAAVSVKQSDKRKRKRHDAGTQDSQDTRKSARRSRHTSREDEQNTVEDSQREHAAGLAGASKISRMTSNQETIEEELNEEERVEAEQLQHEQAGEELDEQQLRDDDSGGHENQDEERQSQDDEIDEDGAEEEVANDALDEDQLPTPPKSERIAVGNQQEERQGSSQERVASWLDEHPDHPHDMIAPTRRIPSAAEDDDVDDDNYEVPADSDQEVGQDQRSSSKANGKRKRSASDRMSSVPFKKRARPSDHAAKTNSGDGGSVKIPLSHLRSNRDLFPSSGPFTATEIEIIESTFEDKRKEWNISQTTLNEKIHASSKADVGLVLTELGELLPNRNRKAIQRFCRRHYNNYQRGKWTEEQDDLLRDAHAERPNKWVYISGRVGRMPEDCRDRWRNHVAHGDARNTDVWTENEEFSLVKAIKECLDALKQKGGVEIDHENEDDYIAWQVVVQKMQGTRNRLQCSQKWRKIKARVDKEEKLQSARESGQVGEFDDPVPRESQAKAAAKRRYQTMTPGDIYQVLQEIQYGAMMGSFSTQETFWAVVTRLHAGSPFNTQDRKYVYKQLKKNIQDEGEISINIDRIIQWIEGEFDAELLKQRTGQPQASRRKGTAKGRKSNRFISNERVDDNEDDGDNAATSAAADELNDSDANAAENNDGQEQVRSADSAHATPDDRGVRGFAETEHTPVPLNYHGMEVDQPPSPHVSESQYSEPQ
ncbi:hypothetical protein MBLNU459_g3013t1 [Dothideomycetes sp. NU459]